MLRIAGQGTTKTVSVNPGTTLEDALSMVGLEYLPTISYRTSEGTLNRTSTVPTSGVVVFAKAEANGSVSVLPKSGQ